VPARRKFLKSDPVEMRHLLEEIHRIALAHPEVGFNLWHNDNEVYRLPATSLAQRIVAIFGKQYTDKLLPVGEQSEFVKIDGFVLKSEAAKRSAGDQYFFVNKRFIKSPYLNHAVKMGFDQLLQPDQYAGYFIFIEVDPQTIDVNVHPTKTEIKFDEEKLIYNFLRVCVRHALGKYLVAPTLDFEASTNISQQSDSDIKYITHEKDLSNLEKENLHTWQSIYDNISSANPIPEIKVVQSEFFNSDISSETSVNPQHSTKEPYQLHQTYIVSQVKNGVVFIDQQYAHERIIYEENLRTLQGIRRDTQKELFPHTIDLDATNAILLRSLMAKLNNMGFDIGEFGKNTFIVHGIPAGLPSASNATKMIHDILQTYNENAELQLGIDINLARSYARCTAIKRGRNLSVEEMKSIIDDLFVCEAPFTSPEGHKTFVKLELEDIRKMFA
jgi:DNA mismatch repair protein MutL